MRLFVAIEPSAALSAWVEQTAAALKPLASGLRWVAAGNAHLTLAFLGEQPEARVGSVREAARAATAGRRRFELAFGALGAFDSWKRVRVVWSGVDEGAVALAALADALRAELEAREFALERRDFAAHLTLARCREPRPQPRLENAVLPPAPRLAVGAVSLMLSRLGQDGPRYEALDRFPLVL